MPTLLLALLMAVTAATANVAGFALRAQSLDQRWQAAEAAGVPAASLAEARRELAADEARRAGILPYAVVSGAAISDPFAAPEASANAAYGAALGAARQRAAAALARRDDAGGPNDAGLAARVVQLAGAARPAGRRGGGRLARGRFGARRWSGPRRAPRALSLPLFALPTPLLLFFFLI